MTCYADVVRFVDKLPTGVEFMISDMNGIRWAESTIRKTLNELVDWNVLTVNKTCYPYRYKRFPDSTRAEKNAFAYSLKAMVHPNPVDLKTVSDADLLAEIKRRLELDPLN